MEKIFKEIERERSLQDEQWGGPVHDDEHELSDWINFITKQLCSVDIEGIWEQSFRKRLIKIAALAVAAIESIDRKNQKKK